MPQEATLPPASTPANRFDYVTRLLQQHEHQVTQQSIQIAELARRQLDIENKQSSELSLLRGLKERNPLPELDTLRKDTDRAQRKLDELARQDQASNDQRGLQFGLLQADVCRLNEQVAKLAGSQRKLQAGLQAFVTSQVDALRAALLEMVQQEIGVVAQGLKASINDVRKESSAAASSAASTSMATNNMAVKLRSHVQATNNALTSTNARLDTVSTSADTLACSLQHVEQDAKKVKKHVVKLERQVEGLQGLSHMAVAADRAVAEVKHTAEEAVACARAASTSAQDASALVAGLTKHLRQLEHNWESLHQMTCSTRKDLAAMADSLASTLKQVYEASRKVATGPPSYLSSLFNTLPAPTLPLPGLPLPARLQYSASMLGHAAPPDIRELGPLAFDSFLAEFRARAHSTSAAWPAHNTQYGSKDIQASTTAGFDAMCAETVSPTAHEVHGSGHGRVMLQPA